MGGSLTTSECGQRFSTWGKTKGTAGSGIWVRGSARGGSSSPELSFPVEHQFRPSSAPASPVTCRMEGALIQFTPRVASECELVCRGHERAPSLPGTCRCVARSLSMTCVNAWRSPGPSPTRVGALGGGLGPWAHVRPGPGPMWDGVRVRRHARTVCIPSSGCTDKVMGAGGSSNRPGVSVG